MILHTERLLIREIDSVDAHFVFELLNSPGFLKYIGDRGVRSIEDARNFIENRFRQSYRDNGYGLYAVEARNSAVPMGICGFVRREWLPGPDIGFAFLPQYENQGFALESASAMMDYGREKLGFGEVLAITTSDNKSSEKLLKKIGFSFIRLVETPENEKVRLFSAPARAARELPA